jgi:hypothetical protein
MTGDWERARPWIEAALGKGTGTHRIEDIDAALRRGAMAALIGERSALVCQLETYPQLKELCIFAAGGDLEEIKEFAPRVLAGARALGAARITARSKRAGFARALRCFGLSEVQMLLAKEIA